MTDVQRAARIAGIRHSADLDSVERRRLQLWTVTAGLLVTVSLAVAVTAIVPEFPHESLVPTGVLEGSMVVLSLGFSGYVFEKERALRRLTRVLIDERVMREHLGRQVRQLDSLVRAGKAVSASLELERVVDVSLDGALQLLDADAGAILLVGEEGLELQAVRGEDPLALARREAKSVAASGEPRYVHGPGDALHRGLSVPLAHDHQLLGVLNVFGSEDRELGDLELSSLVGFAERVAAAIANALLYEEERATSTRFRRLESAREEFAWLAR